MIAACARRPALTFAVVATVIILDHVILGPYSYLKWHDLGEAHFTRYRLIAETFDKFGRYYWFPYGAGGVDLLSNGFRFADLFFVFFYFLPYWLVIPVLRFVQLFIAGWFTFLLCRDSLKFPVGAALAGGLFYQFLQVNLMEYYFGLGALPLLAWALERLVRRAGWGAWLGAAGLGIAYSFGATVHLAMFFTLPGLFAWLWLVTALPFGRLLSMMMVFGVFCVLPQADMIWAMMENAPLSHRAQWTLVAPDLRSAVGAVSDFAWPLFPVMILSVIGVVLALRKNQSRPLVLVVLAAATLAAIALDYPVRIFVGAYIGLFRGFAISRFAELAPFYLSIGAAWGLWLLTDAIDRQRTVILVYAAAIGAMALAPVSALAGNVRDWVRWGGYAGIFESPDIKEIAREYKSSSEPFRVAVTQENGLQAGFVNGYGLETAGNYLNMYPYRYKTFWGTVVEPFLKRNPKTDEYFSKYGARLSLFTDDGHPLRVRTEDYFRTSLLALANVKYVITSVPLDGSGLELIEKTKPARYWDEMTRSDKIRVRLKENFFGRRVMVYRNTAVLPRWFLAGARFVENQALLMARLRELPVADLGRTALIAREQASAFAGIGVDVPPGRIGVKTYAPDVIRLDVTTTTPAVLVVTNTFSPHWRVTVDGNPAALVPAYGIFWGTPIAAGTHDVQFRYRPPYALR